MHLRLRKCSKPLLGHCDLEPDYDLVVRIVMSRAHLLYYLRNKSQIWCVNASWDDEVSHTTIWSLWGRNSKFGVYMHLGMGECHLSFSGHCDLDLWPSFNNHCVWSISLVLFEIGIPILVCECILGWWSVLYHLWVTLTLTSDLVFRKIVSGAYIWYY